MLPSEGISGRRTKWADVGAPSRWAIKSSARYHRKFAFRPHIVASKNKTVGNGQEKGDEKRSKQKGLMLPRASVARTEGKALCETRTGFYKSRF